MLKIILLFTLLNIENDPNNDFFLSLEYYSMPIKNLEWKIIIYRKKQSTYIKCDKYLNKKFHKKMPHEQYTTLLTKLNKLHIWHNKNLYNKKSMNSFYVINIKNKKYHNKFKIEAGTQIYSKHSNYSEIIRLIKNHTTFLFPEH